MEEEAGRQTVDGAGVDSWQLELEAGPATVERSTAPVGLSSTHNLHYLLYWINIQQSITISIHHIYKFVIHQRILSLACINVNQIPSVR